MGADFTLYKVVPYGKDTITYEVNIFPSDYRPYITYERVIDMLALYEHVGEGTDWFPNTVNHEDCKKCDEINPQFKHVSSFNCGDCAGDIKLDSFFFAKRGEDSVKVVLSHGVVEQFEWDMPFWTVNVEEVFHAGVGYCGDSFTEGNHPFCDDMKYPEIYHTPEELNVFKKTLKEDFHIERIENFQEEFEKRLVRKQKVFAWLSY